MRSESNICKVYRHRSRDFLQFGIVKRRLIGKQKREKKGEGTGGAAQSAPSRRRGAEAPKRRRLCFSHSRRFPIGGYYDTPQWVTCDM